MSVHTVNEVPYLEQLLTLKLTPVLKWNAFIRGITKNVQRMISLTNHVAMLDQIKNGVSLPYVGWFCRVLTVQLRQSSKDITRLCE